MDENKLLQLAKDFVRDTHTFSFIYAIEGGVIELDKYLVDFIKFAKEKGIEL